MEQMLRDTIEIESIKQVAITLLRSEGKELKEIKKFHVPNGLPPYPDGIYSISPGKYSLLTSDGLVDLEEGDYIIQTLYDEFYYIRLKVTE